VRAPTLGQVLVSLDHSLAQHSLEHRLGTTQCQHSPSSCNDSKWPAPAMARPQVPPMPLPVPATHPHPPRRPTRTSILTQPAIQASLAVNAPLSNASHPQYRQALGPRKLRAKTMTAGSCLIWMTTNSRNRCRHSRSSSFSERSSRREHRRVWQRRRCGVMQGLWQDGVRQRRRRRLPMLPGR